jgi:serine phosphatase RsbU (regulator of sigma subunit)
MSDDPVIKKLQKEVKVLTKKLTRSETNRTTLEEIRDRNSSMFQVLNAELDEAKKTYKNALKVISSSIEFASYIQKAILPDEYVIASSFQDYFLIWEPRDVVGGDIYFIEELKTPGDCLIMIIDCTGHGVPGAFVTALVKAVQQQIITELQIAEGTISPAKLLGIFSKKLKHILKQNVDVSTSNVGFDGGILYYNKNENLVKYAGAETPLFYIQDDTLNMIKGDRQSIGYKKSKTDYPFKDHSIPVDKETRFYLTTDGFLDQNGGEKGYPFGKKNFKQMVMENYQKSFSVQQSTYLEIIKKYRGIEEQTDDITFIGLKIK